MAAVAFASGCFGHNCDGDTQTYGHEPGQGHMVDANQWESTTIDGEWFSFSRQRTVIFELKGLEGRTPNVILPYISAEPFPVRDGNWTLGFGNLTEQSGVGPARVVVRNNSCSDFFIRLVVTAPPQPTEADSGPPTDASVEGSATDASDASDAH